MSICTGAWLSCLCGLAHADRVHLKGGSMLEGTVVREDDKIVVQLESGSIRLDAASVARIEKAETPLERITRLRAALPKDAVDERLGLANLCRAAQLVRCERELLEEVIARDTDHAEARLRLGYVRGERGWLSPEEQAQNRERAARSEREAQTASDQALAQAAIVRDTAELSRKQAELALERERIALQRAELERTDALRTPTYLAPWPPYMLQRPGWTAAPQTRPFILNGVRSPSEPGFHMPGVRPPGSYFP